MGNLNRTRAVEKQRREMLYAPIDDVINVENPLRFEDIEPVLIPKEGLYKYIQIEIKDTDSAEFG